MVLAALPGMAMATTFTDTVSGATTMQVTSPPLGGIGSCYLASGSHPYAARTLTTNNTTEYTFRVTSVSGLGNDPFLAVYAGSFNPADPNQNLVSCNDDYNGLLSQFSATLSAGSTYVIVTTAYWIGQTGSATYDISPDVTLAGAPLLSAISVSGVTSNSAVLQGTSSSAGTGYYVVQSAAQAAPSVAQVLAGQQSTGAAALVSGNGAVAANAAASFPLAPLAPGTGYTAYLVVRDNQNPPLSSVPGTASFTTVAVAPQAPTIGTATAGNTQASVTFTAPASNGGSVVTQYTATSSPGNITATGTSSPIVVAGLTNGTSYTFTVTATNAIGTGPASAPSNAVTPIGPAVLGAFGPFTLTFGDAPVTLPPPSSPSAGAFSYTSSNPAVATISGDVVTIVSAGTSTLTANQAADGAFTPGSTSATLTVDKAVPAITGFNDLAAQFGDNPLTLADPASNSAGTFSYASSDPAVATVSGNTVTIVGAGTTTITATQTATANYLAGSSLAQLTVSTVAPTLGAFGNLVRTFNDPDFSLAAPSSNSAGAFTYTSSNPAVATVAGDVVTIIGAGITTLTAIQAANGNYATAQITAQLSVGAATPVLTGFADRTATFGDAPISLNPPASPSAGAFSYSSGNPAVATVSGNIVTIVGSGSVVITVTQAANGNYSSAQATAQLTVGVAAPVLSGFDDLSATFGDAPITLVAPTSPSAGAFTYISSNPAIATISGNVVTFVSMGSTTITATQAANGNYATAQITAQLSVGAATPALTGFADRTATFGDAPITLTAPTSPSAGGFTYTSSNPAVATISGNVVTITGSGTATLTATQAANGNYAAAQATAQLVVGIASPVLAGFDDLSATFGDAPITLVAPTSPSAGAFTYTSSNPEVATLNGNVVTIVAAGTTTLTATQAANGSYAGASISAQLVVGAATPTITGFTDLHKVIGQAAFDLVDPTSNSAGAFTYSIDNAAIATVSGRTVTITGAGTATITATQAATANYSAASVSALLVVDSRPDPTKDAEVVGSLQAQMDAALRFATAQQANVRDRLRQRRSTEAAGRSNGLSVNANGGNGGVALQPELLDEADADAGRQGWSLWTGGTITTGNRDQRTGSDRHDFRSDGVTVGADTRIGKDMLLGMAVGGGWSDIDVGSNGSQVNAKQRALTVYGLWHGAGSLFVDGQLAMGKLDYDLRRWSTVAGTMADGQREGSQVFGSVTFGYEALLENSRLTTYGRVDAGRSTLDAYRETGLGIYDLQYREQTVQQRSVAIGLEGSHNVKVDWARDVRPYWQLEYRNDFSNRSDAAINYVVAPVSDDYRLSLQPWVSSNWNVGFGADFAFGNGVIVTALVRHELNVGMGANTTFGLQFSLDFGDSRGSDGSVSPVATDDKAAGKKK